MPIELLEAAKHFFNVDHIVFVVCLDRAQLAHSVKAVYGACFDAEGYLWRFFDIDYRLPQPRPQAFHHGCAGLRRDSRHVC